MAKAKAPPKSDKIYRSTAKAEYHLTDRELNTLPAELVVNPHYRSGPKSRIYLRADVKRLAQSAAVKKRLGKKAQQDNPAAKHARREQRHARMIRAYPTWKDALLPACEAMFNLNRYAKHESCRSGEEIYALKNQLVKLLYEHGACIECLAHERTQAEKECFGCKGTGERWSGEECERCDGTGVYREARILRDIAFKFMVCGRVFAWHQPESLVNFPYEVSAVEQGCPAEEKPLEMSLVKMRDGKAVIRYVLSQV